MGQLLLEWEALDHALSQERGRPGSDRGKVVAMKAKIRELKARMGKVSKQMRASRAAVSGPGRRKLRAL